MGVIVIDRRQEPVEDKFGTDRQRFLQRNRDIIRKAINDHVAKGGMRDFEAKGVKVPIPRDTVMEPIIHHGGGGSSRYVFPGLMKFDVGDRIPKPEGGSGQGGGGDPSDGEGEDDFVWLSPDEMLSILFEGRRLPDMTKLKAPDNKIFDREHAGYTNKGPSQKLDMDLTNRKRAGEALILSKMGEKRVIENLIEQYNIYAGYQDSIAKLVLSGQSKAEKRESVLRAAESLKTTFQIAAGNAGAQGETVALLMDAVRIMKDHIGANVAKAEDSHRLGVLEGRLVEQLKSRKDSDRYRPEHLTYKYDDDTPRPGAKAVLFCTMDVSGSMTQDRKNIAKSFFWLMNKFLTTAYDNVEIVFIAHTTSAKEVDEETFFYGRESGGTAVSSCLEKTKEVIAERYPPSEWNIYGVQASDGENWTGDNAKVTTLLRELLPNMQAYYYIQVEEPEYGEKVLPVYKELAPEFPGRLFTAELLSAADGLEAFKYFFPSNGTTPPHPSFVPA